MATKRKGKYVIRTIYGSSRIRFYFPNKKAAARFKKFWGVEAAIRENV